jgi:hypothetical protein
MKPDDDMEREHLRRLAELWDDVIEQRLPEEEAIKRLATLKAEQEELKKRQGKPKARKTRMLVSLKHPMKFTCTCPACTKLYTITMQDRKFLKSIGISWSDGDKA